MGYVDFTNCRTRKVLYVKLIIILGRDKIQLTPLCYFNGLSYMFFSTKFENGTKLSDFLTDGKRCTNKKKEEKVLHKVSPIRKTKTEK